jgi:hypothetical protein
MVRNLFVLSLLSFAVVGCMGPKKGPSPVTDGAGSGDLVPTTLAPVAVTPVLTPEPAPAPAAPKKAAPTKGKKLPLNSNSSK